MKEQRLRYPRPRPGGREAWQQQIELVPHTSGKSRGRKSAGEGFRRMGGAKRAQRAGQGGGSAPTSHRDPGQRHWRCVWRRVVGDSAFAGTKGEVPRPWGSCRSLPNSSKSRTYHRWLGGADGHQPSARESVDVLGTWMCRYWMASGAPCAVADGTRRRGAPVISIVKIIGDDPTPSTERIVTTPRSILLARMARSTAWMDTATDDTSRIARAPWILDVDDHQVALRPRGERGRIQPHETGRV